MSAIARIWCLLVAAAMLAAVVGCNKGGDSAAAEKVAAETLPSDDQLRAMIDEELNYTYKERSLDLDVHGAWQIMHGVLPFGMHMKVYHGKEPVSALQWVLDGHAMRGWTLRHGTENLGGGRQGLRSIVETGKVGQGHPEQWLSIMAQNGIKSNQKIIFDGRTYEIRDMVQQALWESYEGKEASWDLTAFIIYLGPDAKWKASDGQDWSIERLVSMEAKQDLGNSACGGTHRLSALNRALSAHLKKSPEITGAWEEARDKLRDAIDTAHRYQQPDGSLSTSFFTRSGYSPDPVAQMYATGHTLEFLVTAVPQEELSETWIKRAVYRLCIDFKKLRSQDVECGSLYHATNGLLKYRLRRWGAWQIPDDTTLAAPTKPEPSKELQKPAADKQAATPK